LILYLFNIWRGRENKTAQFYSEVSSGYYERDNTELNGSVFYLIPYGMSDILRKTVPTIGTEKPFKNCKWKKNSLSTMLYLRQRSISRRGTGKGVSILSLYPE